MINTLRITSIAAAILAGVLFLFSAVFGVRSDVRIEEFLNSPGVLEKFQAQADKDKGSDSQVPPLVSRTRAFALYLNPPPKSKPKTGRPRRTERRTKPKPITVTPKFELVGTSFYPLRPQMSLALINEPGKGYRWVRQSATLGHLIIEQIKDGSVIVRDSKRTFEIAVPQRLERRNLIKGKAPSSKIGSKVPPTTVYMPAPDRPGSSAEPPQATDEEIAMFEEFMKSIKADVNSDKTEKAGAGEIALMEEFISELESMRITAEEANKLDDLGRELDKARQDFNQPPQPNEPNE